MTRNQARTASPAATPQTAQPPTEPPVTPADTTQPEPENVADEANDPPNPEGQDTAAAAAETELKISPAEEDAISRLEGETHPAFAIAARDALVEFSGAGMPPAASEDIEGARALVAIGGQRYGLYLTPDRGFSTGDHGPWYSVDVVMELFTRGLVWFDKTGGAYGSVKVTPQGENDLAGARDFLRRLDQAARP